MKRLIVVLAVAIAAHAAWAGGWTSTYSLTGGTVGVTNTQANSSWAPVSVMLTFNQASSGTAEVRRVSQGYSFLLANCAFSNVSTVVWVPDAEFVFTLGDALEIRSTVTGGVVQVIRKGL